jgi:hypothetical protein
MDGIRGLLLKVFYCYASSKAVYSLSENSMKAAMEWFGLLPFKDGRNLR